MFLQTWLELLDRSINVIPNKSFHVLATPVSFSVSLIGLPGVCYPSRKKDGKDRTIDHRGNSIGSFNRIVYFVRHAIKAQKGFDHRSKIQQKVSECVIYR